MKYRLSHIPFLRYQLITWCLWGLALWLYVHKVVPEAFSGWPDWAMLLGIHIITANLTAFWCCPKIQTSIQHGKIVKALAYGIAMLLAVPLASILISMLIGALAVRPYDADPRPEVINIWQVLMVLYAGVMKGLVYYGALWARHLMRLDGLRFARVEQQLQRTIDDRTRERLNAQLMPHLLNNLMDTLHHAVKWHPSKARQVLYCITEMTKAYSRYDGHSLIPLRDELDLMELYLVIIAVRQGYEPNIYTDLPDDTEGVYCIPMLLILLVENMGKYAELSDSAHPAYIKIRIREGRLLITAENRKRKGYEAVYRSNTGLANLAQRLKGYWGEDAAISITGAEPESTVFQVHICCHTALFV